MTAADALAFFAAMLVLAAMPSLSVLVVVSRSAALGVRHGVATAIGIVAGDLVFIAMAILGMTALAAWAEWIFGGVQLFGGLYLIGLGLSLWRAGGTAAAEPEEPQQGTCAASFMAGLLLTLADQKAVLFYLGFFPAFLDLAAITLTEVLQVMAITVVAVGGVKIAYALAADRARQWLRRGSTVVLRRLAAVVMLGIGGAVLWKLGLRLFA